MRPNAENLVAWDFETDDVDNIAWHKEDFVSTFSQEVTGVSFCSGYNMNRAVYVPLNHRDSPNWNKSSFTNLVKGQLTRKVLAHNLTFEYTVARNSLGIPEDHFNVDHLWDTAANCSLVDHRESAALKYQTKTHLGYSQKSYTATLEAAGASKMSELTLDEVFTYGVEDALTTAHLAALQRFKLLLLGESHLDQDTVALQVELAEGYLQGSLVDWEKIESETIRLNTLQTELHADMRKLLADVAPESSEDRALKFFGTIRPDLVKLAMYDGKSDTDIRKSLDAEFKRILVHSKYLPYEEEEIPVKVTLSVSFLATVMPVIGLPAPEKVTIRYLHDTYFKAGDTPQQKEFIDALLSARPFMAPALRDAPEWAKFEKLCRKYTTKEPTIKSMGFEMNLGSPKQLQYILYSMLGLPVRLRSKVDYGSKRDKAGVPGSPATDEDSIKLALMHDVKEGTSSHVLLTKLHEYAKADTLLSLFYRPWKNWAHRDGLMRPQFRVNHTVTRRPGGSAPNFLQLPAAGGVRDAFLAGEGYCFLSVDFSNQELRILADETQDPALLACYTGPNPQNIHTRTATAIAEKVYKAYYPKLLDRMKTEILNNKVVQQYDQFASWLNSKDKKLAKAAKFCRSKRAKGTNFTVVFGGSGLALARNLLIEREEADEYIAELHALYPGISQAQEAAVRELNKFRYIRNAYGAIYKPSQHMLSNSYLRSKAGRTGFNFKMQGTAAHVLYETGRNYNKRKLRQRFDATLKYPIYDEIVVRLPNDPETILAVAKEIDTCMHITPPGHSIPQVAEFTLHPKKLESGEEIGVMEKVTLDKINEVLNDGKF